MAQFTEPIRTKQGYVILKVTEHTPGGVPPLKDVENQVEDAVGMAKMNPASRDYLTKLREDAYIEIKSGYEDSGASPNEMKPVYSAYAPPTPKKKKHVERTRFRQRGRNAGEAPVQSAETAALRQRRRLRSSTPRRCAAGKCDSDRCNHRSLDGCRATTTPMRPLRLPLRQHPGGEQHNNEARQEGKDPLRAGSAGNAADGSDEDRGCRAPVRPAKAPRWLRMSPL